MATKKIRWRNFDWAQGEPLKFPCNRNIFVTIDEIKEFSETMIKAAALVTGVNEKSIINRNWEFFILLRELAKREDITIWQCIPSDDWDLGWLEQSLVLPVVEWYAS